MAGKTLTLEVVVDADNKGFAKVMNDSVRTAKRSSKEVESVWGKANRSVGSFGGGALAGIIGVGAVSGVAREITSMAGGIADMSEAANLSTEEFQQFSAVLMGAGGDSETLTKLMASLTSSLEDAKNGSDEARDRFIKMGFSLDDIQNSTARDALLKIADALKFTGNQAQTNARYMDLVGTKLALKTIPALKAGKQEFLETGKAAKVMSDQTIKNIDSTDDAIQQFKRDTLGQIANFFVDSKEGLKNGGSFWQSLKEAFGGEEKPITTPAVSQAEIQKKHDDLEMSKATMMDEVVVTPGRRPGFWQTDRPAMSKTTGNEERFGPMPDGSTPGGFGGFGSGYFPGSSGGLTSGGLTAGGLTSGGLGKGKNGDAWGKVRRGDAQRAKDAASGKNKDPQLESIDKNTAALAKVWGAQSGQ